MLAAVAVGVFHTMVPDHWAPLALIARQRGWSLARTARAAALAGVGHTVSTLAIAVVVWFAGVAAAARLGNLVEMLVSAALIIVRDVDGDRGAARDRARKAVTRTSTATRTVSNTSIGTITPGAEMHDAADGRRLRSAAALARALDVIADRTRARSSARHRWSKGIPAFFAAAKYGAPLLAIMSVAFALATIGTYVDPQRRVRE